MLDSDKKLKAFNLKVLQGVFQVKRKLEQHGISWGEFGEWLEKKNSEAGSQGLSAECKASARYLHVGRPPPEIPIPAGLYVQ